MSLREWLERKSGLDIRSAQYSYGEDPVLGYSATAKHAERWVNSTCGYCSVGCGMQLGVREGKVVSVRGNPNHPVNLGKLCPKGLAEHHAIEAEDRAKYPLLRKNGELTRVSWDEALDTLVEKFRSVQSKHGPESLGIISTGQLVTEEFYALGKLVQLGFGTRNYDGNTTLCMSTAVAGYKRSFGSDGPPGAYEDLEVADVILLIGANVAENHPILCARFEANTAKTLIVADPRVTKTAMMADVYLPLKPRSDLALINAIARILIDEELYNKEYVERHTTGFEELYQSLEPYTLEDASEITGLSPEVIRKTALLYGNAKAAFIGWTMGVNHSTKGTETVNAINNLALLMEMWGAREPRRSRLRDSATPWARARRASRRAYPVIANSNPKKTADSWPGFGISQSSVFPQNAALPTPTSLKPRSAERFARYGLSEPIPWSHFPISTFLNMRWAIWIFWSCRMDFTPRPRPN